MSSAVSVGELHHVSASQITNYKLCARRWWFEKVAKFPVPPSAPAELGQNIHKQMERYYEEGVLPEHPSAALLVKSGLLPEPGPMVWVEEPADYQLGLTSAGVAIHGKIDLLHTYEQEVAIWDWKSKGNLRYAKRRDELERDLQMMIYGAYVYSGARWIPPPKRVRFVHGYIKTEDGVGYKIVDTDPIEPATVQGFMTGVVEPIVEEMKGCARAETYEAVTPNFNACYAFRKPCPHLERCTVNQSASVYMDMLFKGEGEGDTTMDLTQKLSSTSSTLPEAFYKEGTTTSSTWPLGLTLLINAPLVKGEPVIKGLTNVTYLEDIIAAASKEICEKLSIELKRKVLDLRMVPYGEGKGLLAAGLRQNPPTGVVVATTGELSDVAIEALLPLADTVIRGTR